jgi:hypothetical protein
MVIAKEWPLRRVGCLLLCTSGFAVLAVTSENPYQAIVDRNVFSLKAPPPPAPTTPPAPPAPKVTLNGITDIFGYRQALLTAQISAKPGEPAKTQSFILQEDERQGDLQVLKIDLVAGTVKIINSGTEMTLTMEKDAAKPSGGAPGPVAYTPPPNPYLPAAGTPTPGAGVAALPVRTLRLPQAPGAIPQPQSPYGGVPAGGVAAGGGATLPGFSFGTPSATLTTTVAPGANDGMSQEEREILVEANHQVALATKDVTAPYFPPTRLNPTRNTGAATDAGTAVDAGVPTTTVPAQNPYQQQPVPLPGRAYFPPH